MKNKLLIPIFSLLSATVMYAAINPPTNHVCNFPPVVVDNHIETPVIGAWVSAGGPFVLTAATNFVDVGVEGGLGSVTNGEHEIVTTFEPCTCGETNAPYSSFYPVAPDAYVYDWACASTNDSRPGASFSETVRVLEPGEYSLSATINGYRTNCSACVCSASASTNFIVYKLTVGCDPLYIGLDRTDDGTNKVGRGIATLTPTPDEVSFKWNHGGVCFLTNQVDTKSESTIECRPKNKEDCSVHHLDQRLTITATGDDPYFSGSATTNFTVVKVDVMLNNVGEEDEETIGAFFSYVADVANDVWSAKGTNELKSVSIKCWPENLPTQEIVTVSVASGYLFQKDGDDYIPAKSSYPACEISTNKFFFHAHTTSVSIRDGIIEVKHIGSGAVDKAKYTVIEVISIEPEPAEFLENYYSGSPLDSPTNRIYTIPVTPTVVGNVTDIPYTIWPIALKMEAKIKPDIPENELPDCCQLEGGRPDYPSSKLVKFVGLCSPDKEVFTFMNCGVDSGLKTTVYVFDARIKPFADEGDRCIIDVGHSWGQYWLNDPSVELIEAVVQDRVLNTGLGFWPVPGDWTNKIWGDGEIRRGGAAGGTHPITGDGNYRAVSFKKYKQALFLAYAKTANPPQYGLYDYNCTDFAIDLGLWVNVTTLSSIGLTTPWAFSDWLLNCPGL